jgi:NAD(P)-dependent dehydrogenase (short-subunit alcohol dehydrogenase family)
VSAPLAGRAALVTGASRGIGLAIAEALVAGGARVVMTSRGDGAERAAAELGAGALGVRAHASDPVAAAACVQTALDHFGSLDILVNNAATNPAFGPLVDLEPARVAKTLDVNLVAPLMWSTLAWHAYMAEHGGSIINISSIGGLVVAPNLGVYNVSKAGLIHLTRQLAFELAPKVRVNAIAAGVVRTRLAEALWKDDEGATAAGIPLERIGEPADLAAAVAFLTSDKAAWITGETLVIDGGQRLVPSAASTPHAGAPIADLAQSVDVTS